ncbi:hypothetical protein LCGC14_1941180 [marine sediment metagenome]|uniref:Uncharacterized protein n=1 Tax=marine sediment metagenome TaxID=412755 RepID=A0A0F9FKJ4_9ZZZZ
MRKRLKSIFSVILFISSIVLFSLSISLLFKHGCTGRSSSSVDVNISGIHIKGESSPKSRNAYYDTIIVNTNAFDVSIMFKKHSGSGFLVSRDIFRLNSGQRTSIKIFHSDIILIRRILPDEHQVDIAVGTLKPTGD